MIATLRSLSSVLFALALMSATSAGAANSEVVPLKEWRDQMEQKLRSPYGWLSMVGLLWLDKAYDSKDGLRLSSKGTASDIGLPANCRQDFRLRIRGKAPAAKVLIERVKSTDESINAENVLLLPKGDESKSSMFAVGQTTELSTDQVRGTKVDRIRCGQTQFQVIWRKEKFALRVADSEAPARLRFSGRRWFSENKDLVVKAKWIADATPRKVMISDVLGGSAEEISPGVAEFKVGNETIQLRPILEDDQYFFIFRDQTSRDRTYSAGRFLYASREKDGFVDLDFNRAYNPPCAFNKFTTCPLPMKENILRVRIEAGELKPN